MCNSGWPILRWSFLAQFHNWKWPLWSYSWEKCNCFRFDYIYVPWTTDGAANIGLGYLGLALFQRIWLKHMVLSSWWPNQHVVFVLVKHHFFWLFHFQNWDELSLCQHVWLETTNEFSQFLANFHSCCLQHQGNMDLLHAEVCEFRVSVCLPGVFKAKSSSGQCCTELNMIVCVSIPSFLDVFRASEYIQSCSVPKFWCRQEYLLGICTSPEKNLKLVRCHVKSIAAAAIQGRGRETVYLCLAPDHDHPRKSLTFQSCNAEFVMFCTQSFVLSRSVESVESGANLRTLLSKRGCEASKNLTDTSDTAWRRFFSLCHTEESFKEADAPMLSTELLSKTILYVMILENGPLSSSIIFLRTFFTWWGGILRIWVLFGHRLFAALMLRWSLLRVTPVRWSRLPRWKSQVRQRSKGRGMAKKNHESRRNKQPQIRDTIVAHQTPYYQGLRNDYSKWLRNEL